MSSVFHIQDILRDNWPAFIATHTVRQVVAEEVEKVIHCGDWHYGFAFYRCPDCGCSKYVPFRCHSRFCNTCGIAYQADRSASIAAKLIQCKHRHIVFTIPKELRIYFRRFRSLLHILFRTAANVVLRWSHSLNKKEHFEPGMVCGLHTFGRDLKWNPHIHMLLSEGLVGNITKWKNMTFFPFKYLRSSWQTGLLKNLGAELKKLLTQDEFIQYKSLVNRLYKNYNQGFYVNAPRTEFNNPTAVAKYITRYIGRPAMAQSRIINYDGKDVTFWYQRHNDNKKVTVKVSAEEFIKMLIIHIPDRGFNMLRYYGVYAKPDNETTHLVHIMHKTQLKVYRNFARRWAVRMELSFKKNPLKCHCGSYMILEDIYIPGMGSKKSPPIFKTA